MSCLLYTCGMQYEHLYGKIVGTLWRQGGVISLDYVFINCRLFYGLWLSRANEIEVRGNR